MGESRDGNFIREFLWFVPTKHGTPISKFFYDILEPKSSQPHDTHQHTAHVHFCCFVFIVRSVIIFYCSLVLLFCCSYRDWIDVFLHFSRVINIEETRREATFIPEWPVRSGIKCALNRIERKCVMGVVTRIPGGLRGVMKWKTFSSRISHRFGLNYNKFHHSEVTRPDSYLKLVSRVKSSTNRRKNLKIHFQVELSGVSSEQWDHLKSSSATKTWNPETKNRYRS